MTRVWLWRKSRRGAIAMIGRLSSQSARGHMVSPKYHAKSVQRVSPARSRLRKISQTELFPQINPSHVFVSNHLAGFALHQHLAVVHDVSPVDDVQRLPHVM